MISVCMATYNGERFIKEQIDSILSQLTVDDELIISDDGSTDGTMAIITSYCDKRIKVLHHQKNPAFAEIKYNRNFYYATSNFENALNHAKGDYIFFSDQDDVWDNDKLTIMCEALNDYDFVMSNYSIIDNSGRLIQTDVFKGKVHNLSILNILTPPFLGCIMGFRRNILNACLPFPQKLIAHDLWVGCIAMKSFRYTFLHQNLVLHRKHECNVSNVGNKSRTPLFHKVFYRIILYFQLIKHRIN